MNRLDLELLCVAVSCTLRHVDSLCGGLPPNYRVSTGAGQVHFASAIMFVAAIAIAISMFLGPKLPKLISLCVGIAIVATDLDAPSCLPRARLRYLVDRLSPDVVGTQLATEAEESGRH